MSWLLKLYPHGWRRRYGAELEELVASQPRSLQLAIDLLGGAIDAHWKPQAFGLRMESATSAEAGGTDMIHRLKYDGTTARMSRRDTWLSAALAIGGSLVVAAILAVWEDPVGNAVALVMVPGVWLLAIQPFYLRGHSTVAKVVLIGGPLVVLAAIGFATAYVTNMV